MPNLTFEEPKDPDAVLDYVFDWKALTNESCLDDPDCSDWLSDGESITSYTVTAEDGLTLDSDSQANGAVTVWVSGGTEDTTYSIHCQIVTSAGRTDERTMYIRVRER